MAIQSPAWTLPAEVPVIYVEREDQLDDLGDALASAVCCAIDAEWPPEETRLERRRGAPPHATLVQLALWLPPGCPLPGDGGGGGGAAAGGCCVLLLDMLALPQAAVKPRLQALLRAKGCLKLGYGLVHDLRAVAAALGPEGGSCVAVVEPACDPGSVHRFLRHNGVPGVRRAPEPGLSGLVHAQLGLPLDKEQQCSAWGERPLSAAQLAYAAADAACLLALLGSLAAAAGRPEDLPMVEAPDGGKGGGDSPEGAVTAAAAPPGTVSTQRQEAERAQPPATALLGGCTLEQLRGAAAAWGIRLEICGGRAVRRGSRCGGQARRQRRQAAAEAGGKGGPAGCPRFPAAVPWLDDQRQPTGPPRFLADVMAEGLARQLRLCGYDCESLQASMERAPRHAVYRAMVERGEGEGRVVLTKDRGFVGAAYTDLAFLVTADTKRQQLEEVLGAFGLRVGQEDLLTRCARCNGTFLPDPVPPSALPDGHAVPPRILEKHEEFWQCARCSAVYWQGFQYARAMRKMGDLLEQLGLGDGREAAAAAGGGAA